MPALLKTKTTVLSAPPSSMTGMYIILLTENPTIYDATIFPLHTPNLLFCLRGLNGESAAKAAPTSVASTLGSQYIDCTVKIRQSSI